jgi:hypothetical protein
LEPEFRAIDDLWNNGPFAPVECGAIDKVLNNYYGSLLAHKVIERQGSKELTPAATARLLGMEEDKLRSDRGAWKVVLNLKL